MGCCASSCDFAAPNRTTLTQDQYHQLGEAEIVNPTAVECLDQIVTGPAVEMDLATALAADRHFRAIEEAEAQVKVSLTRLLEEGEEEVEGMKCCVCVERKKGAAFIPCGHTFCRTCSRELWINRGSCPLCNRRIVDILHIF